MVFRILDDENDGKLRIKLSCGDMFFKRKPDKLVIWVSFVIYIGTLLYAFISIKDLGNKDNWGLFLLVLTFMSIQAALMHFLYYEIHYDHNVLMTVSEDVIEIKSLNKYGLKPIFIDRDNIKDIYVERQKIDYSSIPLAPDKTQEIYRIFLQCRVPIYLPLGDKQEGKFMLFWDNINENEYYKRVEPNLKILRDKLNLSKDIDVKMLKEKYVRVR